MNCQLQLHAVGSRSRATRLRWSCDRRRGERALQFYSCAWHRHATATAISFLRTAERRPSCKRRARPNLQWYLMGKKYHACVDVSARNCNRNFEVAAALAAAATPLCNWFARGSALAHYIGRVVAMHILWLRGRMPWESQCNAFAVVMRS